MDDIAINRPGRSGFSSLFYGPLIFYGPLATGFYGSPANGRWPTASGSAVSADMAQVVTGVNAGVKTHHSPEQKYTTVAA